MGPCGRVRLDVCLDGVILVLVPGLSSIWLTTNGPVACFIFLGLWWRSVCQSECQQAGLGVAVCWKEKHSKKATRQKKAILSVPFLSLRCSGQWIPTTRAFERDYQVEMFKIGQGILPPNHAHKTIVELVVSNQLRSDILLAGSL